MLHIIGTTKNEISIGTKYDKDGNCTASKEFELNSIGTDGYVWEVSETTGLTLKPLFQLKLDVNDGLIYSVQNGKTRVSPAILLSTFSKTAIKQATSGNDPEKTGSILFAVATEVLKLAEIDESGIRLNQQTKRLSLTANDWIAAYLKIEADLNLPPYLRPEFIAVMKICGLTVVFPQTATVEQTVKDSESVKQNRPVSVTAA